MSAWFTLVFVLIVSISLFIWLNKKKNVEGFGAFFDNQNQFTEMQRTYFQDQIKKEIIVNQDIALPADSVNKAFNQPDVYLATSPDRDYSVYFREEDNRYTREDEKVCRAASHPRNLKRASRATVGCGWWFVSDPPRPTFGAL